MIDHLLMKKRFRNRLLVISALTLAVTMDLAGADSPGRSEPDAGLLAAVDVQAVALEEGVTRGDFETWYPEVYPGFSWTREVREVGSNGLFQIDYAVFEPHSKKGESPDHLSLLLFRPQSRPGHPFSTPARAQG